MCLWCAYTAHDGGWSVARHRGREIFWEPTEPGAGQAAAACPCPDWSLVTWLIHNTRFAFPGLIQNEQFLGLFHVCISNRIWTFDVSCSIVQSWGGHNMLAQAPGSPGYAGHNANGGVQRWIQPLRQLAKTLPYISKHETLLSVSNLHICHHLNSPHFFDLNKITIMINRCDLNCQNTFCMKLEQCANGVLN